MNGHISPIVEHAAQIPSHSALRAKGLRDSVLISTGELLNRYEFGEQPHRLASDSPHPQNVVREEGASEGPQHQHQPLHSSIINSNTIGFPREGVAAEAMANQSWPQHSVGGDAGTTNHRGNSPGNPLKRTQEMNRERSLGSSDEADNSHPPRHRTPETQPQHLNPASSIPLATFPHHTPPTHEATAAEIALGISSPFHFQHTMGHDSRSQNRLRPQETADKSTDIASVIESLSEVKDRDEENTSRTSETGLVTSPGRMTPLNDSSDHGPSDNQRLAGMGIGTPSTVSTAPSTDDASLGTDYRLDDSLLPNLLQGVPGHTRSNSWGEEGLLPGIARNPYMPQLQEGRWLEGPPSPFASRAHWEQDHSGHQQRIASFRDTLAPRSHEQAWPVQNPPQYPQHHQQRRYPSEQAMHFGAQQIQPEMRHNPTHPPQQYGVYPPLRREGGAPPQQGTVPIAATPPRPNRNPRPQGQLLHRQAPQVGHGGSPHQPTTSSSQRSASEILKTLLRKKACLYEPDTSRSVALVTWLVGRELALECGFFSRQQLQSGVHACVADKIESGTITRTKVNRCMQIILNSCFHYIIPRSDGSEENGDVFRYMFAQTVQDDSFLLQYLPAPWNNLEVNREDILLASMAEEEEKIPPPQKSGSTPKSSPRLTSVSAPNSPGRDLKDHDDDPKRAVLLCFNENVRSAEDVFRCHNEFIRDTANAAHLQLTAQEWRSFFGRDAARAPYLWGNIGIPIPSSEAKGGASRPQDALGQMSEDEAAKFRTSWCAKRYDHDHDLCGFAHVEVCGGWLRRNPDMHPYEDSMCPYVSSAGDQRVGTSYFFLNECPLGVRCDKAHSMEEILYHPQRYKTKNCTAVLSRSAWCQLGDLCPNVHPPEATRSSKKSGDRSHGPRHQKKPDQSSAAGFKAGPLPGSPMIYASPAPFSNFERHLGMPGLQSLFRRHCSVVRAHVRTPGACNCVYSCFGDDLGINDGPSVAPKSRSALPNPS